MTTDPFGRREFVAPEVVHLLRRDLVQLAGEWSCRGGFVFCDGTEVGRFADPAMAQAVVDFFTLGIPLLNELVRVHQEVEQLRRSIRQVLDEHPDYRRRPHAKR